MTDIESVYAAERDLLVGQLRGLTDAEWASPSLCDGWSVRDVAAHLLMPYGLSFRGFVVGLLRARFRFDRFADRWARADIRTGPQLVEAIAATTASGFNVPGAGETAPLSHLFLHAQDIREPLDLPAEATREGGRRVLDDLTHGKRAVDPARTEGLHLMATDIDWSTGLGGPTVTGPAAVLANALMNRSASAVRLEGSGADRFRSRF
ncbi:hypothetical protein NPS01_13400 [Nocardioides psychrotolerans]|uniref:TIGR03083 family protein n=1 Tax=Nocardioides psychrotolerans TaxID=1005945 RepID=A0A1I3HB84_9ACTN|nr:maleylpyruvate isomerase family mycothiol-dependent enzyme [Nocardioides psychrotolerans]GEP37677.1 hypothetical protein NPS01_13400 [Nocardioides psychrotolerans]SFI32879.1 TIGR03083 family protein [Nocardioides psychrotolerans]